MKKVILLLSLLCFSIANAQWQPIYATTNEELNDVQCLTEEVVYAAGNAGTLVKTVNGGSSWSTINTGITEDLVKIYFVDENKGYALTQVPFTTTQSLLKTTDAGMSWSVINNSPELRDFAVISDEILYFTAEGVLYQSTDSGVSFTTVNNTESLSKIQFINPQIGYAYGDGQLKKTSDGGLSWSSIFSSDSIRSFNFYNEATGYVYTDNGLYKTQNGGLSFEHLFSFALRMYALYASSPEVIWGSPQICLLNFSECYAFCGQSGGGNFEWQQDMPQIQAYNFVHPNLGYAVGQMGTIFKNTTGLLQTNSVNKNEVMVAPNPATDYINIDASMLGAKVEIQITNNLGKSVLSQTLKTQQPILLSTNQWPSGFYFIKLNSAVQSKTFKLIIR
jgi:photosystem II stability/assembly factor-like uncharacterized protein